MPPGRRSGEAMETAQQHVQAAMDYIEAHLDTPLPLDRVAAAAGLTRYHLHRLFQAHYCEGLKAYIRKRRLTWAAARLRGSNVRILELALDCGFESQAAFTRAFKALYGTTPGRYRARPARRYQSGLRPPTPPGLAQRRRVLRDPPQLVEWAQPLQLAGRGIGVAFEDQAAVEALWMSVLDADPPAPGDTLFGVTLADHPAIADTPDRCLVYLAARPREAGAEAGAGPDEGVPDEGAPDEGGIALEIPAGAYAVFVHDGPLETLLDTVNYAWASWLPRSGWVKSERPDFERFRADAVLGGPVRVELWVSVERADRAGDDGGTGQGERAAENEPPRAG
ncbi:MAG: hypothetical protein CMH94_01550 [Oceanicaulis sp.]|nr:hypothetical protein [Oceanicaulis sp.]MBI74272.1 hypothetical protein [Oceanicaulis sp.]